MSVRLKAAETVGRTPSEPHLNVTLSRVAVLDKGLSEVESRDVEAIVLEFPYIDDKTVTLHPRHLDALIELLERTRDRLNDIDPGEGEDA